jgi:NADH-quinone oxidoreductase subunit M
MLHTVPLLSLLIWLPILGAILVASLRKPEQEHLARWVAVGFSALSVALSLVLYYGFDPNTAEMQYRELVSWVPALKLNYSLGVDGIAVPLIMLTTFTTLIVVLASWTMVKHKVPQYLAAFMITQGAIVGVFSSLDGMLFYFFWEAMLIPMYLSIGIWGMERRSYAAIKFFIYTFFGSALLLIALLYLRMISGSFEILDYYHLTLPMPVQVSIFLAFLVAFAIKIPMWPVHTWLPDAHTEAPVGGSVVLAALMLKLGGYGFLRFSLPIVPDACRHFDMLMIVLSLVAIVYIGLVAIAQTDMKKLIAYSSVAHMGFVTLGCFLMYKIMDQVHDPKLALMGLEGAMVQMISHAFGAGAMFLAFGILYQQMHTRYIRHFGGIAKTMPIFSAFFMVFAMSNVGLPGTSGFVGEFLVILSGFQTSFWITFLAATTLVIGAAYTLWMYKRVFFGPVESEAVANLQDVRGVDTFLFVLLTAAVLWIGLYPEALIHVFHTTLENLLEISTGSRLM